MRKCIQNLYAELILTIIAVAFGTILLSAVREVQSSSSLAEGVDNVAAYVINGSKRSL